MIANTWRGLTIYVDLYRASFAGKIKLLKGSESISYLIQFCAVVERRRGREMNLTLKMRRL